jgi:hypothetical protein
MSRFMGRAAMGGKDAGSAGVRAFLWTDASGQRHASWHVTVLVWVAPVVFALGFATMAAEAIVRTVMTVPTTGEVVRVHDWNGEYSPVFRYVWSDGRVTEASSGLRDADWNFEIGSIHAIRYFASSKRDVVIVGAHNWYVAGWIAFFGLFLAVLSAYAQGRVNSWLRGGSVTPS